ncbi:AMP-binding protein [Vibrio sp. 16]|uniref:AMP-binding protein n=1 Tax=Vibrio sp. 16 TaxID=391586 RepID=UPI000317AFD0|nr:AMP-binding protein [Vibrio sp. 16]CAK4074562.1 D-alanine--D-alanyl carrier protein ligase [Vibrio sp. 16]
MSLNARSFTSISDLFTADRSGRSKVAFTANSAISWQTFTSDVAHNSARMKANRAQRIALCFEDSYLFAVGFFAACLANKSLVLPGNYQPEAVRELSEHFDLLFHDDVIALESGIETSQIEPAPTDFELEKTTLASEEIALVLFTSGSSGQPKAISKTLHQLETEVAILDSLWGEKLAASNIESTVSHQHIYGLLFRVLWPLCAGRPFATRNLEFPEQVVHHANPNTALISSPALLKRLTQEHQSAEIRAVFSSGGPLPTTAAEHCLALFNQRPIEVFGSTETGGIAHRQQLSASTPWQLFPGVTAELNSERCLRLKSPHIDGDNWYQTADECRFHDSMTFELLGRTDRVVKVEEKRISLVEVEKRLDQLNWISESAVITMTEGNRLSLYAVIVLTASGEMEIERLGKGKFWLALRKALRDWLEPIAIPRKFRLVKEIPLNSQGKRQVAEIEKQFQ